MSAIGSILCNSGALDSLNALRLSSGTRNTLEGELSSGKRITSAASDPAGYITTQGFTSQIGGLTQALSNTNQGVALLQTAMGGIGQEIGILQKINSIAVQASNGTETDTERRSLQKVMDQLVGQMGAIAGDTEFNNQRLLDGTFSTTLQVGPHSKDTVHLAIGTTSPDDIGAYLQGLGAPSGPSTLTSDRGVTYSLPSVTSPEETLSEIIAADNRALALQSGRGVPSVRSRFAGHFLISGIEPGTSFTLSPCMNVPPPPSVPTVTIRASSLPELLAQVNRQTAITGIKARVAPGYGVFLQAGNGANGESSDAVAIYNVTSGGVASTSPFSVPTGYPSPGVGGAVHVNAGSGLAMLDLPMLDAVGGASINAIEGAQQALYGPGWFLGPAGYRDTPGPDTILQPVSGIDLSTATGAMEAVRVAQYGLNQLSAESGKLGAVQQRLRAMVNNDATTIQSATSARSTVQDANIPKVAHQLTQQQVLQAAGIAALKHSTALQQAYSRLLP